MEKISTKEEIFTAVKANIEEVLGNGFIEEEIVIDTKLGYNGLMLSSFDYVMLVVNLERDLDIRFPDEMLDFDGINSVADLVNILYQLQEEQCE